MERYQFTEQERAALEGLQQPFAVYQFLDKRVVSLILSDGFCELFGYEDRAQAYFDMDNNMYREAHPDDVMRIANEAHRFAMEGGVYDVIYRTRRRNGSDYRIIHATGKHVLVENGVQLAHVWYTDEGAYSSEMNSDAGELNRTLNRVLCEESLLKANSYDYLTGLPSMTYFFELAEAGKKALQAEGEQIVFLYFDMNGMKFYNNKHGFAEGDALLKSFAKLLSETFTNENCCHIGADHFAAFTKEAGVEDTLNELFRAWEEKHVGTGLPVRVGIYVNSMEDVSASAACDRAKIACDSFRRAYASGYGYYNHELKDDLLNRHYVEENIDRALEERWIQVYFQPIVRALNGRVCDEEALARWIDPVKGFLSPAEFIPYLEDSGQLYKLDLYVLDRILEKFNVLDEAGIYVVPQSLNLSRSDFDACDIVEEIRSRVDAAGISRSRITIEITESIIGSDFDFMKEQVERFQSLGFAVWMDDFGNGYSSLDVLQTIKFNLIKFDMSFMQKLDEGTDGKIILTELMRMTTALGVDTVCEGVETEEQARFLREIGCSKLQGFYYSKPVPTEVLLERFRTGTLIPYENPEESPYYETIGRVNLYDLSMIAYEDANAFQNYFNTLPMAVLEIRNGEARFVHSNESYRAFVKRFFEFDLSDASSAVTAEPFGPGSGFMAMVKDCCQKGNRAFFDEQMPDGSVIHSFAKRLGTNPVTGKTAVAVAVLSITESKTGTTFANIAKALASDYYSLYYVDLETGDYIEYSLSDGLDEVSMESHGKDFFENAKQSLLQRIYEKDRAIIEKSFTKENVLKDLEEIGSYKVSLRLIDSGEIKYSGLKVTRMQKDPGHLIVGLSHIDSPMKRSEASMELWKDADTYARIMALAEDYLSIYIIDPVTGHYRELNATDEFNKLGVAHDGEDFFEQGIIDSYQAIHPDDLEKYQREFNKEKILATVREKRPHIQHYRLVIDGKTIDVSLKIALVRETDGDQLIAGIRAWKERRRSIQ